MKRKWELREAWAWLAIFMLVVGYLTRSVGLLTLAGILLPGLLIAWAWNRVSLNNLTYTRRLKYRRGFPGEKVECEISVENRKLIPLAWARFGDRWPWAVAPEQEMLVEHTHSPEEGLLGLVLVLRGFARVRRRLELKFRERGAYKIGPVSVSSGDPFALFRSNATLPLEERVVVFPEVLPLKDLGLRADDPFGLRRSPNRLFKDNIQTVGVRDYLPGDGFRRIHWPASARIGSLQSRVYQPVSGLDLIVCLNISTLDPHWMGVVPEVMEGLIKVAASVVTEAFDQGYRVGLVSNGSIAHSGQPFRIPPGRSPKHLPLILEALAGVTPIVTTSFATYLLRQAPHLEYGSTLVVLTAVTPGELVEALIRLRERTRRTTLISVEDKPPPFVPGIQIIHLPLSSTGIVS